MKQITASHYVIVAVVTAALLMSAALAGCSARRAAAAPADAAEPIAVTVAQVAMTDVASAIDSGGVVQARTTATIAARILAPVREVRVSPGDQVRKARRSSCSTATISPPAPVPRARRPFAAEQGSKAAAAELQAAEAGLALARASHDRIAGLQAKRSATAQELDDATATLRSAEARRRCVRAGIAGRVGSRAPGPPATRRAPPNPSPRLPRPSTAWSPGRWSSPETWRHQACPSPPGRHSRIPPRGPRGRITHRPDSKRRQRPGLPRDRDHLDHGHGG